MTEINISPLITSKYILNQEFNILIRKTSNVSINNNRYVIELHFKNVDKNCLFIMKQYKEDSINKDILKFCKELDIDYKTEKEIIIPSFFFKNTDTGKKLIKKWKTFFCNYELTKENIIKEKKIIKPVPKHGLLAFSHMQKISLRQKLIARTKYKILLKKIH
jgi:hypothetical protein